MFWSSDSTDAAGREVRKAPSRENIKGIRETKYGADLWNCSSPSSPPPHLELFIILFPLRRKEAKLGKKVQELMPRESGSCYRKRSSQIPLIIKFLLKESIIDSV